jgi:hypothetical protein
MGASARPVVGASAHGCFPSRGATGLMLSRRAGPVRCRLHVDPGECPWREGGVEPIAIMTRDDVVERILS